MTTKAAIEAAVNVLQDFYDYGYDRGKCETALTLLRAIPEQAGDFPQDAIENLTNHQRQLDMEGCEVGVSRQAVDEVLTYIAASGRLAQGCGNNGLSAIQEIDDNRAYELHEVTKRLNAIGFSVSLHTAPGKDGAG